MICGLRARSMSISIVIHARKCVGVGYPALPAPMRPLPVAVLFLLILRRRVQALPHVTFCEGTQVTGGLLVTGDKVTVVSL